jgi:drug/metabolite transporter (DMT)-like permease
MAEKVAPQSGGMMRKDRLDGVGLGMLLAVALVLAVNQIIIKIVDAGLQPVFFAGLRSALAIIFVGGWLWYRGLLGRVRLADLGPGLLIGLVFAIEFIGLFVALDLTTVGHAALIMYSMPVWMGILAHFFLPGERATPVKAAGLALAFLGTGWAITSRGGAGAGQVSWLGDFCALIAAFGWAGTAFIARVTRLRTAGPEAQLFWMVLISAPILLAVSPLFGPLIRDVTPMDWVWLVVQAGVVVAGGFVSWLWLLSVYPTSTVASFSFLTPILSILMGHFLFGESLSLTVVGAAVLVSLGIILINRKVG